MKTLYQQWLEDENIGLETRGYRQIRNYRDEAISKFGFAILDGQAAERLKPHGPYLEVGCGTGYWAYELGRVGCDVIATDPHPLKEIYLPAFTKDVRHVEVEYLTAEQALRKYGTGRTLLVVWPSLSDDWPARALRLFLRENGKKMVYVGEGHGGCTADDEFHDLIDEHFEEAVFSIPNWWGIHDRVHVCTRKT